MDFEVVFILKGKEWSSKRRFDLLAVERLRRSVSHIPRQACGDGILVQIQKVGR